MNNKIIRDGSGLRVFINQAIERVDKTHDQIAAEVGIKSSNMISMIRNGKSKLSLSKVASMAKCLEVDTKELFELTMLQHDKGEMLQLTRDLYGQNDVTENEYEILRRIREVTKNVDVKLSKGNSVSVELVEPFNRSEISIVVDDILV